MSETLEQQMKGIAEAVARRYHVRCWWADLEDLEQQAWVVVLEVLREYAPKTKAGELDRQVFGSWAYVACMRQLSRYLWRQSSPVSAADGDLKNLAGVHHGWLIPETLVDPAPTPEEAVDLMRIDSVIRPAIRQRIVQLYSKVSWTAADPKVYLDATLAIYLDGKSPSEAAKALGADVYTVYKTTECMRGVMRADRKLRGYVQTWQESLGGS